MSLLSLNLSLLNDHDMCVLKLRDSTANARPAFSWCLFIVMTEKKTLQAFLKQACSGWHTAQEGIFYTNFRAEMAGGGGGRDLPRQALGLGGV